MKYLSKFAEYDTHFHRNDPYPYASWVENEKPIFTTHHMDFLKVLVIVGFIVVGMIASF